MTRESAPCTEPRKCRSCGASILWAKWARSGKPMPIDAEPSAEGTIVVTHRPAENVLVLEQYREGQHQGRRRFTSHFATCPTAATHRKPTT